MLKNFVYSLSLVAIIWAGECSATQCPGLFVSSEQHVKVRAEILTANLLDRSSGRLGATVSNAIETRAKDIESYLATESHVVSLGSGPDVYLPLYLHPTAKYFHLVDHLGGWGDGPEHVIKEIEARLGSISPEAVVERMDSLGDWRKIDGVLMVPLVWRVRWNSPAIGPQEKLFFLHQLNFEDLESMEKLKTVFSSSPYRGELGGVVITGTSASPETRKFLLSELQSSGSMFTEMLYVNNEGETTSPGDRDVLRALAEDYEVTDLGKLDLGFRFNPHQFLIRPKRQ
jgi:hypothetical protein